MVLGGTPFLICIAIQQGVFVNDSYSLDVSSELRETLMTPERHLQIVSAVCEVIWLNCDLVLLTTVVGVVVLHGMDVGNALKSIICTMILLALQMFVYYLVYVLTPAELTWHLNTSLERVMLQLWPALVLTTFMLCRKRRAGVTSIGIRHFMKCPSLTGSVHC